MAEAWLRSRPPISSGPDVTFHVPTMVQAVFPQWHVIRKRTRRPPARCCERRATTRSQPPLIPEQLARNFTLLTLPVVLPRLSPYFFPPHSPGPHRAAPRFVTFLSRQRPAAVCFLSLPFVGRRMLSLVAEITS